MIRLFAVLVLFVSATAVAAQDGRRELIRACVGETSQLRQSSTAQVIARSGGVTCPAADVVGFPPRERKHDRSATLVVDAGPGRVICPGTSPFVRNVSDNGGTQGNVQIDEHRTSASLFIGCSGAGLGAGRRWYNAELVAQSCSMITEDMLLDITLECAAKLE